MLWLALWGCTDGGEPNKPDDCEELAWLADLDGDGFGDLQSVTHACEAPEGHVSTGPDCDDTDAEIHPGADELCDEIDSDCDGRTDEGMLPWYTDSDGDGVGGEGTELACEVGPGLSEIDGDCDDADPNRSPFEPEQCDGLDQDCDSEIDEGVGLLSRPDTDEDGYGDEDAADVWLCEAEPGFVQNALDCDDEESSVFPGSPERCDLQDNDCDGQTDEGVTTPYFSDLDADGYGDPDGRVDACSASPGLVTNPFDCDDNDSAAHAGATEVCDEFDNDCDGQTDEGVTVTWYADLDGDGFGHASTESVGCVVPGGAIAFVDGDCDDSDDTVFLYAVEVCDGIDQDCDGTADDGLLVSWWHDEDGDSYGDDSDPQQTCIAPAGSVLRGGDCDDQDDTANAGALEICDGADDDCDGFVDDTVSDLFWPDADSDGYGAADQPFVRACSVPDGYTAQGRDCDDSDELLGGATCPSDLPGPWATYGGDDARTGYAPGFAGGAGPVERWRVNQSNQTFQPPAVGDGLVLLTSNRFTGADALVALDLETGAQAWSFTLAASSYPASPALEDGRVYVTRVDSGSAQLFAVSVVSGTELWRRSIGAQWDQYHAPLVMDGQVFLGGGAYGGLYAFDAISGTEQWFVDGPQVDGWTPVGADGVVWRQIDHDLFGHDPVDGALVLEVGLPGEGWSSYTMDTVPAIADGDAFLIDDDDLLRVDLATGELVWRIEGGFAETPAVAQGLVYAVRDGMLVQIDALAADVIRTFPHEGITGKPVITHDAVFASSGTATWMYDLATGAELSALTEGGALAVAEDSLIVTSSTRVVVYEL